MALVVLAAALEVPQGRRPEQQVPPALPRQAALVAWAAVLFVEQGAASRVCPTSPCLPVPMEYK